MDKAMKIAVILTAIDQMSSVVDGAVNKSLSSLQKFQPAMNKIRDGLVLFEAGKQGFEMLGGAKDAFGDMQESANKLKAAMIGPGGVLDSGTYNKMFQLSETLSEKYANTTSSYLNMMQVLRNNKISEQDILGGVAESTAKLADLFDQMDPAQIGEFAARMRNDMGVSAQQMDKMMDIVARVKNLGVGKTGPEAVEEMNQFFSKVGLGLANLHVQGLAAGQQMAALGTIFMRRGISGQSVGTNFRRILDGIRDPERYSKAQAEAAKYHKTLSLFDKQGQFLGIDNFVAQIDKLRGLNPNAIAEILKPFSGRQGLSTDFLEFLANDGLAAYQDILAQMGKQASLGDKLNVIMGGQNYQQKVMETSWTNLKAAFFSSVAPALTSFFVNLNALIVSVRKFAETNPMIAKVVITIISLVSAGLMLAGIIKIIQGVAMAFRLLNLTMLANPVVLVVAAIVAAAFLIYKYWAPITAFFKRLWAGIKNIFADTWSGIKMILLNANPIGWVIQSWNPVMHFFTGLGSSIKNVFNGVVNWLNNLGSKFFDAGKEMIRALWLGIKSMVMWPINEAKKLGETLRGYMHLNMGGTGANVNNSYTTTGYTPAYAPIRSGDSSTYHFHAGDVHLSGGATQADANRITQTQQQQFEKMMKDYDAKKRE